MSRQLEAWAPGRVNLIGDHTDYCGGLAMPAAIQLGTTVTATTEGATVRLTSDVAEGLAEFPAGRPDPDRTSPPWARYVAAVAAELRQRQPAKPPTGLQGQIRSTVPLGAGLSSSASLEVAVALALGATGSPLELALLAQAAEHRASGVPCGLMDQWCSAAGVEGHALLMDFTALSARAVAMPEGLEIVVVDSGQHRRLAGSAYLERHQEFEEAAAEIGPLRQATLADTAGLAPLPARRARHVISENERVLAMAEAFASGDRRAIGELLGASHASLRDDFEVSTPVLDDLVAALGSQPGVLGARMTGGGFGGCVVALAETGALAPEDGTWRSHRAWVLVASGGAQLR